MRKFCFLLWFIAASAASAAAERFSGTANLSASKAQTSANARFSVTAELQAAPAAAKTTADGRFSLLADLAAPKSALTACGVIGPDIFRNGFEN